MIIELISEPGEITTVKWDLQTVFTLLWQIEPRLRLWAQQASSVKERSRLKKAATQTFKKQEKVTQPLLPLIPGTDMYCMYGLHLPADFRKIY